LFTVLKTSLAKKTGQGELLVSQNTKLRTLANFRTEQLKVTRMTKTPGSFIKKSEGSGRRAPSPQRGTQETFECIRTIYCVHGGRRLFNRLAHFVSLLF